jgi:hypothetical protein
MSFIITLYVREGLVMAADSRLTLNATQQQPGQSVINLAVTQSDASNKLFLAPGAIGIATCGAADSQGIPIAGYIEAFIAEELQPRSVEVDAVPQRLLAYFQRHAQPPETTFLIAGYKTESGRRVQHVWRVRVQTGEISRVNAAGEIGATWDGEGDILQRLMFQAWIQDEQGAFQALPKYDYPLQFFTLQDAIDFAVYAQRMTIDSLRFQTRPKTVGGPIDVLVMKPDGAIWVQHKSLHA